MIRTTLAMLCLALLSACATKPLSVDTRMHGGKDASHWIVTSGKDDTYARRLAIRTNPFAGIYASDQPIAVSIEIRNEGPVDPQGPHPEAQLFPHLNAWITYKAKGIDDLNFDDRIPLEIENRLWIKQGETFVYMLDLKDVLPINEPGVYHIALGHSNFIISDLGDWTGELRSQTFGVVIQPTTNNNP